MSVLGLGQGWVEVCLPCPCLSQVPLITDPGLAPASCFPWSLEMMKTLYVCLFTVSSLVLDPHSLPIWLLYFRVSGA